MYDYQKVKRHKSMQILIAGIVILLPDSIRQKTLLERLYLIMIKTLLNKMREQF